MSFHKEDWAALGTKIVDWGKANPLFVVIIVLAIFVVIGMLN